jgi:hypothetical protein
LPCLGRVFVSWVGEECVVSVGSACLYRWWGTYCPYTLLLLPESSSASLSTSTSPAELSHTLFPISPSIPFS